MSKEQIEKMARDMDELLAEKPDEISKHHLNMAAYLYGKGWRCQELISVEDGLPEPEKEVLVLAIRRFVYGGDVQERAVITTAMYEDGTISTEDSEWNWYDIDFIYDEENDVQYIPEGWWEYRHYNPDDVYNNAIDDEVTHWMYLPEPPKK